MAVDAAGDATTVWVRPGGSGYEVQAATRPAGGTWQAPVRLSTPGEGAGAPRIAVDPQGSAIVVWESGGPEHFVVEAAARSSVSGAWSSPTELGTAGEANPQPQVALDSVGNAVAVWAGQVVNPGPQHILAATMPAGSGWSAPVVISRSNTSERPQLAVDARGDFTAIWAGFDVIESAVEPAGGSWEAPSVLSELWTGSPAVGVNADGEAVAAWILAISNTERRIQGAIRSTGGSWGAPVDLSEVGEEVGRPDVAIDAQGDAAAIWSTTGTGSANRAILATVRPSGGAWQTPTELSKTKPPESNPQIAIDAGGEVLAVWWGLDEGDTLVESAVRPAPSGSWQTPAAISGTASYTAMPQLAEDGHGNAVAVWQADGSNGEGVIQAAGYEAAGPELRELSIPSSGLVGQPVSFSVSPLDVWSVLGVTDWSFGDGASASGTSATHSYAKAGVYEVRLTSTDVLGNMTSTSGLITVSPAAPIISSARQSRPRWRERGHTTAHRTRRLPVGTDFTFSLNEQATVTFAFTRMAEGRRVGRRCIPRSAPNHRRPHCGLLVAAGTMSLTGHAGMNTVPFQGWISRSQRLPPGQYTLVITARNAAGVSNPKRLTFTVVR